MGLNKLELETKILVGAESKAFLVELAKMTERLEKVASILRAPGQADPAPEAEETEADDFEDAAPAKAAKAEKAPPAASSFDDEDETETEAPADDFEDAAPAPKAKKEKAEKAPKAPKITIDDVNDACKAKVKDLMAKKSCDGKAARAMVLKALKKNFSVESVTELKPEQYAGVITLMKG